MNIFKRHTEEEYCFHNEEAARDIGNYDYKWEKTSRLLGIFKFRWSYNRKALKSSNEGKNIGFR